MSAPRYTHLIRFRNNGAIHHGDAILPTGVTDLSKVKQAKKIIGDIFGEHAVTDIVLDVEQLLSPLAPESVSTVRCLGLNYAAHAKESNAPIPKFPILFYKPSTSLSGHLDPIPVPVHAQSPAPAAVDYECELVVVIGKDGANIPRSSALSHVLGYSVGNDMSQRTWQIANGGGQWGLGKGFDGWAPFGPGIVTKEVLGDAGNLKISTKVNGEIRQNSATSDMIFKVEEAVSFLSRGTTLKKGDLIFLGTPQGVAMGMKKGEEKWLKDGDVVEVALEGVGSITNTVVFDKEIKAKL